MRRRTVCFIDEEIRRSQKILQVEILGNVDIVPGFKKNINNCFFMLADDLCLGMTLWFFSFYVFIV